MCVAVFPYSELVVGILETRSTLNLSRGDGGSKTHTVYSHHINVNSSAKVNHTKTCMSDFTTPNVTTCVPLLPLCGE